MKRKKDEKGMKIIMNSVKIIMAVHWYFKINMYICKKEVEQFTKTAAIWDN